MGRKTPNLLLCAVFAPIIHMYVPAVCSFVKQNFHIPCRSNETSMPGTVKSCSTRQERPRSTTKQVSRKKMAKRERTNQKEDDTFGLRTPSVPSVLTYSFVS
ncbi:unnamed protein product, partial [Ectocarpus sp. 12 AP-2014]